MIEQPVIADYMNGGFRVQIYADGTKIRTPVSGEAPRFPESMDLLITDWCDAGCFYCHEQSTRRGKHGDVDAILDLLRPLPAGVEIAIGGGDPMSHPEFDRLVLGLRDMGLIANVTINGRHLDRHGAELERLISAGALHGVGVSIFEKLPEWDYEHLVVHMIAGVDDPALLDDQPARKVLVLGYKEFGRGAKYHRKHADKVSANIARWRRELLWIAREHHLAFDTLAIEQLEPRRLFRTQADYDRRYMGDEGQFSIYVDGVRQQFGLASYSTDRRPWHSVETMFHQVRTGQF